MADPFSRIRVVSFDCYGTLIDWESGILLALRVVLASRGIFLPDDEILGRYAEYEADAESGAYIPYRQVLRKVVLRFGAGFGFSPDPDELECLGRSLPHWRPFDDAARGLGRLKKRFKLAVLSNVDDDLFAHTRQRLGVEIDYVVTAGQVGAYKPSPAMFAALIDRTTKDAGSILHIAQSPYHDILPGRDAGLTTVWVKRPSARGVFGATPAVSPQPDAEVPDLDTLATLAGV
ncbi:MAG: 2-haloalkanoic acid dehalogenase, type [Bacteroidetes bacterium]|nr:2-haloalkanoic acid dehalogenase, type [Bacteroidota bacterium]MBP1679185.1 2-haloalkanoic acid dehalogenase, type [Bacteroidota bacterium]